MAHTLRVAAGGGRQPSMLAALGLSPEDEAVYGLLVRRAQAGPDELAAALRMPTAAVEAALSHLLACGLVKSGSDGAFSVAPPAVALGALVSEQRNALRSAELALVMLAEEYRGAVAGRTIDELIEVVTGVGAVPPPVRPGAARRPYRGARLRHTALHRRAAGQ
ncbi:helix-turn-helix domain-containing protein [Micromonospora sp. NPDC002717]|uniref:helix-turn-helix domain-containing protein n=1 Tax=Micromonospora sp. NPDC002717 TaxID=3154424 RepID=UPI00332A721A